MKIAILCDTWDQCSPDDFEKNERVFEATEQTTIRDLLVWQRDFTNRQHFRALFEGKNFYPMRIVKMD